MEDYTLESGYLTLSTAISRRFLKGPEFCVNMFSSKITSLIRENKIKITPTREKGASLEATLYQNSNDNGTMIGGSLGQRTKRRKDRALTTKELVT